MENKIISINNIQDCKNFINNLDDSSYILNIKIQDNNYECIKYLVQHLQKSTQNIAIINLTLPYEMIPKKDFETIYNLGVILPNTTCNVIVNHRYIEDEKFTDYKGCVMWDLPTIIKANKSIYEVCAFIEKNNFSPFEAYAYIHKYVSTIAEYNTTSIGGSWLSHDQFFPGAFFDLPEVVCMGYSSLEKEIIDTLNMPGLKCDVVAVKFYNKDRHQADRHARCLVRILDDKYGINQSCYEDPTWDNVVTTNERVPIYAHFAMNTNCHDRKVNDKYDYYYPSLIEMSPKHVKNIEDLNSSWEYNKSKNPISQLQIERAYFNVIVKSKKDASFDNVYSILVQMAKQSYAEQISRRFKGNLIQMTPLLTKEDAKNIFNQNKQHIQNIHSSQNHSTKEL